MSSTKKEKLKKSPTEVKEQRKPRNNITNVNSSDKKCVEKDTEKPNQEAGPELYKNLKRETDEILKINEESNAKYSKRIIKSNWAKYEAPIDSYEEIVEIENQGADFDELVSTTFSSGGHFQFKQEKSWDNVTEPSHYDRYFNVDMGKLAISLSSIPFNERNGLDSKLFTESEILSMSHRSEKFRHRGKKNRSESYEEPTDILLNKIKESLIINEKETIENIKNDSEENENVNNTVIETVKLDMVPPNINTSVIQDIEKKESPAKESKKITGSTVNATEDDDLEEWLDDLLSAQ